MGETSKIKIEPEVVSQYYISLYFEALKRIDRVNDIKVSLLKLTIVSTFLYFAWLIVNQDKLGSVSYEGKIVLWFIPAALNAFGLAYNSYLKHTASRYGKFTRYLVEECSGIQHLYGKFLAKEKPFRCHMSQWFWISLLIISLMFAAGGIRISA